MKREITVSNSKILLEQGEYADEKVVVFLPGMSGGALGSRFESLARLICDLGHTSVRMHAWENEADVHTKTVRNLYAEIEAVVSYLLHHGFEDIVLIGKSFGGGLVLAYEHPHVTQKIMWAPAISVATEETISMHMDTLYGDIPDLLNLCVGISEVKEDDARICIIHGTADMVIPLSNSRAIVEAASGGELREVVGGDHSFKDPVHEELLLRYTKEFLEKE